MFESSATKRIIVARWQIHGRFMSSATLVRFALLGGAAFAAASGCGMKSSAPRLLEVPANVRPIGAAPEGNFPREVALSAPAQYEQPQASTGGARITSVSPVPGAAGGWSIREPAAGPVQEPIAQPATPPRRSEFVPIAIPAASAPRFSRPAPEMPTASDFSSLPPASSTSPNVQDGQGQACHRRRMRAGNGALRLSRQSLWRRLRNLSEVGSRLRSRRIPMSQALAQSTPNPDNFGPVAASLISSKRSADRAAERAPGGDGGDAGG